MTEAAVGALKPPTGMTPQQSEVHRRRVYLSAAATSECAALDADLVKLETQERIEPVKSRPTAQSKLSALRKRYQELKC